MPPMNMINVPMQAIWTEVINKEDVTRLVWHQRRKGGDMMGHSRQTEVFKKKLELNAVKPLNIRKLPPIDRSKICRKSAKSFQAGLDRTALQRADKVLAHADAAEVLDMYPVERRIKEKLYTGFTKEEKGRYQYLKLRKKVIPERKYQFPLLSSWDYGWRLDDSLPQDKLKKPDFGRTSIIRDTFYTHNTIPQYHKDRHLKTDDARAHILMS